MQVQSLLLGGGNARLMHEWVDRLPVGTRLGSNADAFRGGFRLWMAPEERALLQATPVPPEAAANPEAETTPPA